MSNTEDAPAAGPKIAPEDAPDFSGATDPFALFDSWMAEANRTEPNDPNAMSLATVDAGAVRIYMLHYLHQLDLDPAAAGFRVVVSGHSHKHSRSERGGVLYINPGSAGPRRFRPAGVS